MKNVFIFIFILLFLPKVGTTQNTYNYDSLNLHILKYMEVNKVPGLAICAVNDDSVIWSNAYGKANIESGLEMNIDATMMIASVSKTITSTAVMQLWEKGLLDLDADVSDYLSFSVRNPYYPETPITIRHLLTHTSSVYDGKVWDESYECGDPKMSLEYWNENYLAKSGLFYGKKNFTKEKPGTKKEYSNVGFALLGYIVERISKIPFNDYCRIYIFEPLGMNNTAWFHDEVDSANQIVNYYLVDKKSIKDSELAKLAAKKPTKKDINKNIPLCQYNFPTYPDGSVITSVRELSRFLCAIMNDGKYNNTQILRKSTLDKMLTIYIKEEGSMWSTGLGWSKLEKNSLWGHSGGDFGISTYMLFNRKDNIGIIIFQNGHSGYPLRFVYKLYQLIENDK